MNMHYMGPRIFQIYSRNMKRLQDFYKLNHARRKLSFINQINCTLQNGDLTAQAADQISTWKYFSLLLYSSWNSLLGQWDNWELNTALWSGFECLGEKSLEKSFRLNYSPIIRGSTFEGEKTLCHLHIFIEFSVWNRYSLKISHWNRIILILEILSGLVWFWSSLYWSVAVSDKPSSQ